MRKKLAYASAVIEFILIFHNAVEYIGGFFWGLSLQIGTSMVVGIALSSWLARSWQTRRTDSGG